jgi:hypothetical protein
MNAAAWQPLGAAFKIKVQRTKEAIRQKKFRHCERSEAIQSGGRHAISGLLRRFAPRNDE